MTESTSASDGTPQFMLDLIAAQLARDDAEWAAAQRRAAERADSLPRRKSRNGSSVVFTLRLGHDEFALLERRAGGRGIAPSVLARNLIRYGLTHPTPDDIARLADDLELVLQRLRSASV